MLKTKTMDRVCCAATALMLVLSLALWGVVESVRGDGSHTVGYESLLFDQSVVHTIDITMDGWDDFIANATAEEYTDCNITIDGEKELEAKTLIIATGAQAKYLGLPSEEKFKGAGVSACATCDGFFYRKRTVAVVGGGDTACEEALYLASLAKKVYMIVRRDVFRASSIMQEKVFKTPNIEVLWNCNTQEVLGDEMGVTGARLLRKDGTVFDIAIDGFFLGIGHSPASALFAPWLKLDANGYIVTAAKSSETSVPGVFAAGDVQDPRYRQAITAAASGCMAARDAERFLLEQENK